jgi:hypothetical protein
MLMERTMLTTALVVLGALFAAVLGRAMLTPWPSADVLSGEDRADHNKVAITETIARSHF